MDLADFDILPPPAQRQVPSDSWRPPAGLRIISADDHQMEKDRLFDDSLPAKFKDRGLKFGRDPETSVLEVEYKGRSLAPPGVGGIAYEHPGFCDPVARLKAMDSEHVSAAVLYPGALMSLNAFLGEDPDLYVSCMDIYNEWLIGEMGPYQDRLVAVAMFTGFLRPESAKDEVQKIKQLGYRALMMPASPRGIRYNSRELDPVFTAIEESGIPLHFHVTGQQEFQGYGSLGANLTRNFSPFRPLLGQLVFSGILERHPQMTVGFVECGIAWVAAALQDMDRIFRSYHSMLRPKLQNMPSHYWRRQCFSTFMDDRVGLRSIDDIGVENVMWSLDFPHPEGVYGYAGEVAQDIYESLGHEKASKILGGNAARVYGL